MQQQLKGAATAKVLRLAIVKDVARFKNSGIVPMLAILRVGDNADDMAYENSLVKRCERVGVATRRIALPKDIDTAACIDAIQALNGDAGVHGVLVMRPLPPHLNEREIGETLDPNKDVDGMTADSLARVFMGEADGFAPGTAQAAMELLKVENIPLSGREAVIIGRSLVVGRPLAMMMLKENATVTICHTRTRSLADVCRRADILVAAAGQMHMVDAQFVKPGAVLVDVGIHVDENGQLCGDIHPDAYQNARAYTPVPGGVGSVTGWILIQHVLIAAKRARGVDGCRINGKDTKPLKREYERAGIARCMRDGPMPYPVKVICPRG